MSDKFLIIFAILFAILLNLIFIFDIILGLEEYGYSLIKSLSNYYKKVFDIKNFFEFITAILSSILTSPGIVILFLINIIIFIIAFIRVIFRHMSNSR